MPILSSDILTKIDLCLKLIDMINSNKRKSERFSAQAKVRIPEVFKGEALLKDISITGCGIESTMQINIKPGARFVMEVICEAVSRIEKFDLQVESKWIRTKDSSCEVGFSIIASPVGKQFQRYVDYLSFRSRSK
jgi:hypothetical protein